MRKRLRDPGFWFFVGIPALITLAACSQSGRWANVIRTDNGRCFEIVVGSEPVTANQNDEAMFPIYGAEVECR